MAVWVESTGEFLLCSTFSAYSFLEFDPITEQIGPVSTPGIRHAIPGQALNVSGHPRCTAPGLRVPGFQIRGAVGGTKALSASDFPSGLATERGWLLPSHSQLPVKARQTSLELIF